MFRNMKVKPFDILLWKQYWKIAGIVVSAFSFFLIFVPSCYLTKALYPFFAVEFISYIVAWIYANKLKCIKIRIRNTKIVIKQGDIFAEAGKKIIPVNEYFDTHVGDGIIDEKTLHGIYLKKYATKKDDELYEEIVSTLKSENLIDSNVRIADGRPNKYKLGTIFDDKNGFLLLAYSTFDDDNRARLNNFDIASCYMKMWDQIDIYKGSQSICLPVLGGSGMVRFDGNAFSIQQKIELILWSYRLSGIDLFDGAELRIIVHESQISEVKFLELLNYSD